MIATTLVTTLNMTGEAPRRMMTIVGRGSGGRESGEPGRESSDIPLGEIRSAPGLTPQPWTLR